MSGWSLRKVPKNLEYPKSTVWDIVKTLKEGKENIKFQHNGRPRNTAIATDRQITRAVTTTPEKHCQPLRNIQQALVPEVSLSQLLRGGQGIPPTYTVVHKVQALDTRYVGG